MFGIILVQLYLDPWKKIDRVLTYLCILFILFCTFALIATLIAVRVAITLLNSDSNAKESLVRSPWHYTCDGGLCKKLEITENTTDPLSLDVCQLFCEEAGGIWPKPTGHVMLGHFVVTLNPYDMKLNGANTWSTVGQLIDENLNRLKQNARNLAGAHQSMAGAHQPGGFGLTINVYGEFAAKSIKLDTATSEEYALKINQKENGQLQAEIRADSYFGVRHALETLSQLIVFDDLYNELKIARDVRIRDKPAFPYRGIFLDTSRNFVNKEAILRTIEAMAMSKMNTLHWHITDSHSFPYVSRTWPKFSEYGAYTPDKVYNENDVKEIIKFAAIRGVRVLPEFDAPAHVGEGWQWVGHNTTVCFEAEPWQRYCVEPPCGQLNPTSDMVYEILEGIYTDMLRDFAPDIFHIGGDMVNINCWNSSDVIKNWMLEKGWDLSEPSFYMLWEHFQSKAYDKLIKANKGKPLDVVLWTSGLTDEENIGYLDPEKYIIQIRTNGTDPTIGRLIKNNFRVIFSNYDSLYLDCEFDASVGEGNNQCSPSKGWQRVYDYSPMKMLQDQGFEEVKKSLVLGGELILKSEEVDSASIDSRLWPRAAALAERMWSDPNSSWIRAGHRISRHRERLVQRGILADSLEREWCLQNKVHCKDVERLPTREPRTSNTENRAEIPKEHEQSESSVQNLNLWTALCKERLSEYLSVFLETIKQLIFSWPENSFLYLLSVISFLAFTYNYGPVLYHFL